MNVLHGMPGAPGTVIGRAQVVRPLPAVDIDARRSVEGEAEVRRLATAISAALDGLAALEVRVAGAAAEIIAAQREMADDPDLRQSAAALIAEGYTAEAAITRAADAYARALQALPSEYLAARADDVREVARRVVAELRGVALQVRLERPAILVARDLSPAETVELDPALLLGIVAETGSPTGHLAIVAQGLGIPCVVGAAGALAAIPDGATLVVDGDAGTITVEPDAEIVEQAQARISAARQAARTVEVYRDRPGTTADGVHIAVFANVASVAEVRKAVESAAEGVGLFRTELLAAQGLPTEESQYATYAEAAAILRRPLVIRTFDIGGDKPVPGLAIPPEANPFLGWRGIRLALDRPDEILLPQLRALLRVAASQDVRVMLPMVVAPEEVAAVRAHADRALAGLRSAGVSARVPPLGIMVETPAAALTLDRFRGVIDFASIGTNDLVQYTYAADRTNARVRDRAQPLGLATLRLIAMVCRVGIPVAVCGQLAGDLDAVPLLVGLGVSELSVAPARVPLVKQALASLTLGQMRSEVQHMLEGLSTTD